MTITMLYSHHTATPAPLQHRIRFADGSTRTDNSTFTPDELERAGYTGPYERPECDPTIETIDWDATALGYVVRPYNTAELTAQRAKVREQYMRLLQSSDWSQIADYDLGADREAWAAYRQALRDLADAPNPAYATNSNPVFHSMPFTPYSSTTLNSDFGITFHYATNLFGFQDKFVVTSGSEEWETLAFANATVGDGTTPSVAFLARII